MCCSTWKSTALFHIITRTPRYLKISISYAKRSRRNIVILASRLMATVTASVWLTLRAVSCGAISFWRCLQPTCCTASNLLQGATPGGAALRLSAHRLGMQIALPMVRRNEEMNMPYETDSRTMVTRPPTPGVAAVLSVVVPGLGQVYAGRLLAGLGARLTDVDLAGDHLFRPLLFATSLEASWRLRLSQGRSEPAISSAVGRAGRAHSQLPRAWLHRRRARHRRWLSAGAGPA